MSGIIQLGNTKKTSSWASIGSQLSKIKTLPTPVKILASPKTTGVLTGALGLLTGAGVVSSVGKALLIPTVAGVIEKSPKAESFIKERIAKPEKAGQRIGEFIENPVLKTKTAIDKTIKTIKDKPREVAGKVATAGLIGGAIAGSVVAGKKIIEKVKSIPTPTPTNLIPSVVSTAVPTSPTVASEIVKKSTPALPVEQKPINITVKPTTKNYINNIIQSI